MEGHIPVLLHEVIAILKPHDNGLYLDATFGAGGYSKAILQSCNCNLLALDRDPSVTVYADRLGIEYPDNFTFQNINFKDLETQQKFDGIVFDLGVSSMQLDTPERGFSFRHSAPLDMRMDTKQALTAADIVNTYHQDDLADLIRRLGGERFAGRIAGVITEARENKEINDTLEFAEIIRNAVPYYNDTIHPATRTFQALRIEVNNELGAVQEGVELAVNLLSENGILVMVGFHSLEDKIIKDCFKKLCKREKFNKYAKAKASSNPQFEYINKKIISPSKEEVRHNIRSRSAKLRAIKRLA